MSATTGEVLPGIWRFEATHPDWTEEDGGAEGWEEIVAWWAVRTSRGLLLIDPLVVDWERLDGLVEAAGGCAGVVRMIHWHQRSVSEAAARYDAQIWAGRSVDGEEFGPYDIAFGGADELSDGIEAFVTERKDEVVLWLPAHAALIAADAMLRSAETGELYMCPDSWSQPRGGRARLAEVLRALTELPIEHVLVSHGPFIAGDGRESLVAATS